MTHCSESSGLSVCVCNNLALRTTAGRLPATWRVYLAMVELWTLLGAGSLCVVSSHTHTHTYTHHLSLQEGYTPSLQYRPREYLVSLKKTDL